MRWVLVFLIATTPALAKTTDLSKSCPRERTWEKLLRCLQTRGDLVIVHDLADAKLVSYPLSPENSRYELYVLADGMWRGLSSGWTTTSGTGLINFGTYEGDAYRVDLGTSFESRMSIDASTFQPVVIKRITTSICPRKSFCRAVVTSCDMLVHGRSFLRFRGKPIWKGEKLMVAGDTSSAGTHCRVSRFQLTTEEAP